MARILVLDDEEGIRNLLRRRLERDQHEVFEGADGKVGLVLAKEKTPDLIITDLIMPEKEGLETIHEL